MNRQTIYRNESSNDRKDIAAKKLIKELYETLANNKTDYFYRKCRIPNSRIYELIDGDKPTKEEIFNLSAVINIDVLQEVYKELYPDYEESELDFIVTKWLHYEIMDKKTKHKYTWQDIENKYSFTKADDQRLKTYKAGRPKIRTLEKLIGFVDTEVIVTVKDKFHKSILDTEETDKTLLSVEFVIEKGLLLNVKDRLLVIKELSNNLNFEEKLTAIRKIVNSNLDTV